MAKKDTKKNDDLNLQGKKIYSKPKEMGMNIPAALEAEKSVLSLMLKDPVTYVGKAVEVGVSEGYFYFEGYVVLWRILLDSFEKGRSTDIISLNQFLSDKNLLDDIGGSAGLAELYAFDTLGAFFDHHLELLKEKYILRSILHVCKESSEKAFLGEMEVPSLLDMVEQNIMAIRESTSKEKSETTKSILSNAVDELNRFMASKGEIQGLKTGFPELDRRSNGLKPGELLVIAARPAMGKTSFLLNMMENIAVDQKKRALFFSCEMPSIQLAKRLIFARSGVSPKTIVDGSFSKEHALRFNKAVAELNRSGFIFDDTASISISELRAKARRFHREKKLAVIGIDYLQLMRSHSKQAQQNREREIAEISAGLKALAKELEVPIIVLAQLNRGPENRTGNAQGLPRMSDLRESGAIEQDADMIGLLYRKAYYSQTLDKSEEEAEKAKGEAVLDLAKNRNGESGKIPLTFIPELMRFIPREANGDDE